MDKTRTSEELALYFQVSAYPTHVFLKPDSSVIEFNYNEYKINNLPGYYTAVDFKKVLEYFIDEKYKNTDLGKVL